MKTEAERKCAEWISIVTATYNSVETIGKCLESLTSQTVTCQHIIVDGASKDKTLDAVEKYPFNSRKVISEPDRGMYDAMNKGIALADAEIVGILNSDDYYASSTVLEKVLDVFSDPGVMACYGDLKYVDRLENGKVVRVWRAGEFSERKFYWGWMVPHPTFFVRKSIYEKYGGFNLTLGSAADYEIMLRFLVKHKVAVAYISETLVNMRNGGVSNKSMHNRLMANKMDKKAWKINGITPYPWTIIAKPIRKIPQWFLGSSKC